MPRELSESYVDDGFVVVPSLVEFPLVQRICDDALRFAHGDYPVANLPEMPSGASDDEMLAAMTAIHFPHWVSEVAMEAVTHRGIASVLAEIVGAHLAHWDGTVKCMQSMLFLKPPGLQGQAWHQDERFIPTRDRSLVGAWIALDDATEENGCLWVIPGSHRRGYIWPTGPHGRPDEFDPGDEAQGIDASGAVAIPAKPGDVVFFNGYLLHRSHRNRSRRTRRALVNHYMSAASLLPWMMANGIDVATEDYRAIVPVVGEDPYAWKGIAAPPHGVFLRPRDGDDNADVLRAALASQGEDSVNERS